MTAHKKIKTVVLWIARIWGSLILLFLLFMVGAHVVGFFLGEEQGDGFSSTEELLSFICFPISTMVGLALALKWEGLGGLITLLGMAVFLIIRPDLVLDPMIIGMAAPGIFYVGYWLLNRRTAPNELSNKNPLD